LHGDLHQQHASVGVQFALWLPWMSLPANFPAFLYVVGQVLALGLGVLQLLTVRGQAMVSVRVGV
jgi:hypothetical protein